MSTSEVTRDSAAGPSVARRGAGAALAAAGGVGLAVQGRINGQLGHLLGDGVVAALISFGAGFAVLLVATVLLRQMRAGLRRLRASLRAGRLRPWQCLGGACGALVVSAQGLTVPALGVAVFTIAIVGGQVISSLAVDRAGLGPGDPRPVTVPRAAGALLAVLAVVIAVFGRNGSADGAAGAGELWWALLPALAGVGLAWQLAVNGQVRAAADDAGTPTLVNFAVGTATLVLATAVSVLVRGVPAALPGQWWLYVGGPIGICVVLTAVIAVRLVGVLVLGLASIAGQLAGAVLLDVVVPTAAGGLSVASVLGAAITMVAVGVAALRPRTRRSTTTPGP